MSKKKKQAVVAVFGVLCILIMLSMIILGINLYKNRWHKLNFTVSSITVTDSQDEEGQHIYHVVLRGSAKAWFYDFNTYFFNLTDGSVKATPLNVQKSVIIRVDRKGSNEFSLSFDTYDINEIQYYTFVGENILVGGRSKEGTDIRLFLSEYTDKIVYDN